MSVSTSGCPIPFDQQPLNEYRSLQDSCFARWAILDLRAYLVRTLVWWSLGWLLCFPIAVGSMAWEKLPLQCLLAATVGATVLLLMVMVRLYLGWAYVCDRLLSEHIFYEETGWYDGQTWTKPEPDLLQERLIATYEIRPYLKRLRYSFATLGLGLVILALLWGLL
jgi:hypothetical protein